MAQTKFQQVIDTISEDLGDSPPQKICIKILEYIVSYPADRLHHITYGSLKKVVGDGYDDALLLMGIQYLCGERTPLLTPGFEFIDEYDEIHTLKKADVNYAESSGTLIHPVTGYVVADYKDKVLIYFEPSQLAKEIGRYR